VLHSVVKEGLLKTGTAALYLSLGYNAVNNLVLDVCKYSGATPVEVNIALPCACGDAVVDALAAALDRNPTIVIAVVDHITSATALLLPIHKIVALCHSRGIRVCVDGAHSVGQVQKLDLSQLDADYFVSNFHKWLFAPKSAAFLWCRPELQPALYPIVVSHEVRNKNFQQRFNMQGTDDYTAYVASEAALSFCLAVGVERMHSYRTELLEWAVAFLLRRWWQGSEQTGLIAPRAMSAPYMAVVKLPVQDQSASVGVGMSKLSLQAFHTLIEAHRTVVPILSLNGFLYVRLSVQIYNTRNDFLSLAERLDTHVVQMFS